ncbi:MAG: hypothetical protein K0R08_1956, partial [Solimicrobium sp.]|nr:hypothetical protein [Solimicrobium sp.]
LPVRDQALLLISVDQDYRHQLALNRGAFVGKLDAGQESIYSIKCLPVDPNKPKEVRVEMASQFNFLMSILLQSMISGPIEPVVLMDEKVSGVFTISLENSETFVGAHLRLSDVKSMLTIHNADGTVSEVCKNNAVNLPAVPTKLEQPQDDARSTLTIRGKDGTTANGTVSQTHKSSAESQSAVATKWEKLDDDARSTLTIRGNDGTILNAYKDGFENLSGAQTKTMQPDAEFFASL